MPDEDETQILNVLREQERAVARGDAAAAIAALADDVVVFDLPPPLLYRGNAARHAAGLDAWFATWEGGVTTELSEPTVLVQGDLAVVYGLSRMRGTKRGAGPVDSWNRRTVVLRRLLEGWRIVHEHSSYPMAMDGSGRALTELDPS